MEQKPLKTLLKQHLFLLLMIVNCAPEADTAAVKFTSLAQERGESGHVLLRAYGDGYLIGKVGFKEWRIVYGYEDNNHCDGAFTGEAEMQLKQAVSESLRVWLSPVAEIAGDRQIIDVRNVHYVRRDTQFEHEFIHPDYVIRKHEFILDARERASFVMGIVFYCDKGLSYLTMPHRSANYIPQVNLFPSTSGDSFLVKQKPPELVEKNYLPPLKTEPYQAYQRTAVHHEIGHAFGLGDTYAQQSFSRFSTSTGGSDYTAGKQPIAVMGINYFAGLTPEGKLTLTKDDIEGIKWLYRYYTIDREQGGFAANLSDCPAEYVYDKEETKGCVPSHILSFEFKYGTKHTIAEFMGDAQQTAAHLRAAIMQGNMSVFKRIMEELHRTKALAQRIVVIITPDTTGRTVMHAAAWSYRRHGSKFYHLLKEEGMPDRVASHVGITPREIVSAEDLAVLSDKSTRLYDQLARLRSAVDAGDTDTAQQALHALRTAAPDLQINALYGEQGNLLHQAAAYGHAEIVSLLLAQEDIDASVKNKDGYTAVELAAQAGQEDIVSLLLL